MLRDVLSAGAQALWRLSMAGLPKGAQFVRYEMYRKICEATRDLDLTGRVLSISESAVLCGEMGISSSQVLQADYPQYDIANLALPDNEFDVVVSDQVLEHIPCNPQEAVDEVYRVLKPGGIAVHTTCFLTAFHGSSTYTGAGDGDYWRFTHHGLNFLHQKYSRVIAADGWGNLWLPILNGLVLNRMPVPKADWHPINKLARCNRPSYHYVVWVIAQK